MNFFRKKAEDVQRPKGGVPQAPEKIRKYALRKTAFANSEIVIEALIQKRSCPYKTASQFKHLQ